MKGAAAHRAPGTGTQPNAGAGSGAYAGSTLAAARLTAVISPLRRTLSAAAREQEGLPDIPDAQIEILRALPSGCVRSPGDISSRLGLNKSTVSNLLASMDRAGLIVRRPHPGDGRQVEVSASPEALGLLARFDAASAALIEAFLPALSSEEGAALESALPVLEKLCDALIQIRHPKEPS